ncbi:membrane protein [Methylopila jiangsuensis]|uniref:Membrane protein n=1 Tax=Methylopila jiangsuensis TaxID=586230 RepID=A0A9W6JJ15_9HYPH|nr:peptidoglycan DD-metalloendopeptidase family protein [Methylopila jiangsuensis]MDR6285308.1 murein DD-endopeptidase MepM/ murein hydrolase activator NlpD [Methylopila jiangsuensis]GLK77301.1 membrane protein [Methylopila jiangsuensis]
MRPPIALGSEPPLRVDGQGDGPPDPRAVSLRWFVGTVLTGMAGAGLLAGAIYSTLESEAGVIGAPRLLAALRPAPEETGSAGLRKGDRLSAEAEQVSARALIRVSASTRHGDREVVKMRPFVRVSATLAQGPTDRAGDVPPFDPLKVQAAADKNPPPQPDADGEGDLSFVVSDLSKHAIGPDEGPTVPPTEVRARVREAAAFEIASRYAAATQLTPGAQSRLAYAPEPGAGGFAAPFGDDAPPVANVTLVAKSATEPLNPAGPGERMIAITADGALEAALEQEAGVLPEDARAVAQRFGGRDGYGLATVKTGQKLKVLMGRSAAPGLNRLQPVRVSLFEANGDHVGSVALSDVGDYVAIADVGDMSDEPTAEELAEESAPVASGRMRLYNGLYEAALKNDVPPAIIDEMVRIVSYDVDFNRPVRPGDSFEVFYAADEELNGAGEVAFMALTAGGEARRFYRFTTEDDGVADYYDETGKSAKQFLMRKPMSGGVMRSGFGFRRHPVLGYSKMHTGVDWAAPTGTPIVASGNGDVEKAGWSNGYGRQVVLKHANGYESTYNHMSGIARGVTPGARVRQGQVIGYVGSTGLSTGAHLHYEVLINGRFVNPMKIKLPRGRELDGETLASFQRERERVDGLLGRGSTTAARAATSEGG